MLFAGAVALASLMVLGAIAAAWAALPHQLTLTADGRVVHLPSGGSVGDLIESGYIKATRGDILSVGGGVASVGKGGEPTVLRNGKLVALGQPLYDGDVIVSTRGADVMETTVTATAEIPAGTRYIGTGPLMTVSTPGMTGVARVVKGAISGSVIWSDVVVPARASVIVRRTPHPRTKIVALTFDDGPWPVSTMAIVRTLTAEKVPATFFMVATSATKRAGIAREVAKDGFLIGSHSFSHKALQKLPTKTVHREIFGGAERVANITHTKAKWFRSPYGLTDAAVLREVRADNLRIAGWTVDSRDWTRPGVVRIVQNVVNATRPGSIILMHDGGGNRAQSVRALPYIIHRLKKKGYSFVTLDELAAQSR